MMKVSASIRSIVVWLAIIVSSFSILVVSAESDYPLRVGDIYVQDKAGVLSPDVTKKMVAIGRLIEDKTTAQVVVATVSDLDGADIESYATGLFRYWKIGQAETNNGILLLVAPNDRRVRIEVGYGLEGALNDAKAGRILDQAFIPDMKRGNVDSAVFQTYVTIADVVLREYGVQLSESETVLSGLPQRQPQEEEVGWWPMILIGLVILDVMFNRGRLTRILLYLLVLIFSSSGGGSGGSRGGGGGSSGGGGASRSW